MPRSSVKMGSHHVCKTSYQRAGAEEIARLRTLAERELVAVAPLSGGGSKGALVLVP